VILRKIYGPVHEGDTWRIRCNRELNRFIEGEDNVKFIKAHRIRWLGHGKRMEDGQCQEERWKEDCLYRKREDLV
jgi:hypothetical protein